MKRPLLFAVPLVAGGLLVAVFWMRSGREGGRPGSTRDPVRPGVSPRTTKGPRDTGATPDAMSSRARNRFDLLRLAVASRDRKMSLEVINALKKGGLETLKFLVEALKTETGTEMRQAIVEVLDDILPCTFGDFQDGWYSNRADMLAAIRNPANRAIFDEYRALAVPVLVDMVRNEGDTLTRRWAASALGQLGGVDSLRALLGYFRGEGREAGVDTWSQMAMANIWDPEALPEIRKALEDGTIPDHLKSSLMSSLAAMGTDEAVDLMLRSGKADLGMLAETGNARALEEIRRRTAGDPASVPVDALVRFFPGDPYTRDVVARLLADGSLPLDRKLQLASGGARDFPGVKEWTLEAYRSADGSARDRMLLQLRSQLPEGSLGSDLAQQETDPLRRSMILAQRPGPDGEKAMKSIASLLGSAGPEQRSILAAMMNQDLPRWTPAIEVALPGIADSRVRLEMAELLSRSGRSTALGDAVMDLYQRESDPELRRRALHLMLMSDPERLRAISPELTALASGEDASQRSEAMMALGMMGGEEGRRGLRQVADSHPAEAVAQYGRAGVPVMEILRYAEDGRPGLRGSVIAALGSSTDRMEAERALWSMLDRPGEPGDRRQILAALGGVGTRASVQLLEAYAASHPDSLQAVDGAKEQIFRRLLGL